MQRRKCFRGSGLLVLCGVLLAGCTAPAADTIFGRGGEVQWIDVTRGRLKTQVYSTKPSSAHPTLVIVLHGDLFDPTPSYQYAFAQALTQGFDAPAMPDRVRARLGPHPNVNDVVAAGLLRPVIPTTMVTAPTVSVVKRVATTTPLKWWTTWRRPFEHWPGGSRRDG